MPALAHRKPPAAAPQAPALHAIAAPDAPPAARLGAWDVARFGVGLTVGFLLAAAASAPGGGAIVTGQLLLAGAAALVTAAAAWVRHRQARGAGRPHAEHAGVPPHRM